MKNKISLSLGIFFTIFCLSAEAAFANVCCNRFFDITMSAPGVEGVYIGSFESSIRGGFSYHGRGEADCPIDVQLVSHSEIEYLLECDLTVMPSDIKGNYYIFTAKLIDPLHGNAIVVGPEKAQWHGVPSDHFINKPTGGTIDLVKQVIQYLRPFDDKIYDYERIPQTCTIEPDEDEIEGGETINIKIKDLVDHKQRPSKYFQRIMVKVDIGKIKNGVNKHPYYVFEVGNSGSIDVTYEAPEKCDYDTEYVTVYNSCNITHDLYTTAPEDKISEKEITVEDRQPNSCEITYKKKKLEPGAVSRIQLKNFKEKEDKALRPEEKILVKVTEGKILNGKKHGDYRLFKIGNGTVDIDYEAPDTCGLEKDAMVVKNVCENTEEGTIEPDKEIAKKELKLREVSCDLSVNIKAVFQWINDQGQDRDEGNATMTIMGSMKFDESIQLPHVKRYTPQKMTVSWSKKEKSTQKEPSEGCPGLLFEYMGSGSTSIPDPKNIESSSFEIHRFSDLFPKDMPIPIPAEAKSQMVDSFQLILTGVKQQVRGKYRNSSLCGEDDCPCKEYKTNEKGLGVGSIFIRGKMAKDGTMKGSQYWVADRGSIASLGFAINEVGKKPTFKPKAKTIIGDKTSTLTISVHWEFKTSK